MFLVRFCNVVAAEIQLTSHQLVEVLQYEYASLHKSIQTRRIKRELKRKMKESNSYAEWRALAEQYDNFEDVQLWKEIEESDQYDWKYIRYLSRLLTELREKGEYMKLIHVIRSNALKNLGNIQNPSLYWHSFTGTKHLIEAFHKEMITCINYIAELPEYKLSKQKKLEFFSETRHAFGRTALVLSGGASMGQYHYGVTRCLFEEGLIPRVISGSSSGSIFASLLCTKTLEELEAFKDPKNIKIPARFHEKRNEETVWKRLKRLFSKGYYCETEDIKEFVRENVGDVTFQEAYDRTGWILNIVVTGQGEHDGYRLLNYLSAPNVLIWSAVCASCAVPYVFASVDLLCKDEEGKIVSYIPDNFKRFVDGTLTADVPIKDLSEMFNVNHIIVSQVNPMITIFLNHSEFYRNSIVAYVFKLLELIKDMVGSEFRHRVGQMERLGLFPLSISRYFTVLNQQYSGNVTIWAPPTVHDSLHILQHPGTQSMTRGGKLGARGVYYKLNHVSSALGIEKALKKAHSMVRQLPDISSEQDLEAPKQLTNEVPSKWKEDSLFSSEDETRELPVGRRLSSFLAPRSPLVKVLSGKGRSSFKEKRAKQQKKEKDEAKISS